MPNVDNMEKEKSTTEYGEKTIDRGFIKDENKKDPAFDIVENFESYKEERHTLPEINDAIVQVNKLRENIETSNGDSAIDPSRVDLAEIKLHLLAAKEGVNNIIDKKENEKTDFLISLKEKIKNDNYVYREVETDKKKTIKEKYEIITNFIDQDTNSEETKMRRRLDIKQLFRIGGMSDAFENREEIDDSTLKKMVELIVANRHKRVGTSQTLEDFNEKKGKEEWYSDLVGTLTQGCTNQIFSFFDSEDKDWRDHETMEKELKIRKLLEEKEELRVTERVFRHGVFDNIEINTDDIKKAIPEISEEVIPVDLREEIIQKHKTYDNFINSSKEVFQNDKNLFDKFAKWRELYIAKQTEKTQFYKEIKERMEKINPSFFSMNNNKPLMEKTIERLALAVHSLISVGAVFEYLNRNKKDFIQ